MRVRSLLALFAAALALAGCPALDLGDAPFRCGSQGECPSGYDCLEGLCVRSGHVPAADGGTPDGGGSDGGPDGGLCGTAPTGCGLVDPALATGDLGAGAVEAVAGGWHYFGGEGIPLASVEDGCAFVSLLLADAQSAVLAQGFRVDDDAVGRRISSIQVGPLSWWPPDPAGPSDGSLTLTLYPPDGPPVASEPVSTAKIDGTAVPFSFSARPALTAAGIYEMRLSTDLPVGSTRIAWLSVVYGQDDCVDGDGALRVDADPATRLRPCSAEGACGEPLGADGLHEIRAFPEVGVTLTSEHPAPVSAASLFTDLEGDVRFDLSAGETTGTLAPVATDVVWAELVGTDAVAPAMRLTARFPIEGGGLSCLGVCTDDVLPRTSLDLAPEPLTSDPGATFEFSCDADACDFSCTLDDVAPTACESPWDAADLADGAHRFAVRATDTAGRTGPAAVHAWTIDTRAPTAAIVSGPADGTADDVAVFELSCDEPACTYGCALDGGEVAPCTSPFTVSDIAPGTHTLDVAATDPAGNTGSAATHAWTSVAPTWTDVAAGGHHTCAVRVDGTLWCWGRNDRGQLGDGTDDDRSRPARVDQGTDWGRVTAGWYFTCGIRGEGQLWCWGANDRGQLGNGTHDDAWQPVRVGAETDWTHVVAGGWHACGERGGTVECWGYNFSGQLGDEGNLERATPGPVTGDPLSRPTARWDHTCALAAGDILRCWGLGGQGQLGDGDTVDRWTPAPVQDAASQPLQVQAAAAGGAHTCAVGADGSVLCWGADDQGQLGAGMVGPPSPVPVQVGTRKARALASGEGHTCAIEVGTDALWCWGANADGQSGAEAEDPARQTDLPGTWSAVTAGEGHTCAIDTAGALSCWGRDVFGQLGDGVAGASRSEPAPVDHP